MKARSKPHSPFPLIFAALIALTLIGPATGSDDLLILCPADFERALEPLVDHKNRTGIETGIMTLEHIRDAYDDPLYVDDPDRIKNAIHDYFLDQGIQFVMLVGDCTVFPVRYIFGELSNDSPGGTYGILVKMWDPSDLYYADILDESGDFDSWDRDSNGLFGEIYRDHLNYDDIDYRPDLFVGRVPAENVEEVRNYVAKVIRYEWQTYNQDWFKQMTLAAFHDPAWAAPLYYDSIVQALEPIGFSFTHYYHHAIPSEHIPPGVISDGDPTAENITASLNDGNGFILHQGHGEITLWKHSISADDVRYNVSNPYRLPVIFSAGCETARFCPYVPTNPYWSKSGAEYGGCEVRDIGYWISPEPAPVQVDTSTGKTYNHDTIAEEFLVDTEHGAIAYWGGTGCSEGVTMDLATEFFLAFPLKETLGEMWAHAMDCYYELYGLANYGPDTAGDAGAMWIFHHPERHILFGDPSLRVGGLPDMIPDEEPPVSSDNVEHEQWYPNHFTLEISAEDLPAGTGCGVYQTYIAIDGGNPQEGWSHTFSIPEGTIRDAHVEYWSVDFFGREEDPHKVARVMIDGETPQGPSIDLSGDPPHYDGADFFGPVTATITTTDNFSGVDRIICYWEEAGADPYSPWTDGYDVFRNDNPNPGEFSVISTFDRPGRFRLHAWVLDRAGNATDVVTTSWFVTTFVDGFPLWFRDMAHVLDGPADIWLPLDYEFPFDPKDVKFFAIDEEYQTHLLALDTYGGDGWGFTWDTTQFPDGLYNLEATAYEFLAGAPEATSTVKMTTAGVRNRPHDDYELLLDEGPRTADRGEMVTHRIQFTHLGNDDLDNGEVLFDLSGGLYDPNQVVIYDNGELGDDDVIRWTKKSLNPGETWNVRFESCASDKVASGQEVASHAYFRCDQIPVITSDDPDTPEEDDPTAFLVLAEDGIVTGTVMDAYLEQPLAGATVSLPGHDSVQTDQDGVFVFQGVVADTHALTASLPPLYGEAEVEVAVDGDQVQADIYLERNDLTPPTAFLDLPFEEHVQNNITVFTGTATDNVRGTGIAMVELSIQRLDYYSFWHGERWGAHQAWWRANGTEDWSRSFGGLEFDADVAFRLFVRVKDEAGNTTVNRFYSRPAAPVGLTFTQTPDSLHFSWDPVPGCRYLLEVKKVDQPMNPVVYEYLGDEGYSMPRILDNTTYYWRVYSRTGDNIISRTPEAESFTLTGVNVVADIKINGSDGPLTVADGSDLGISVSVDPGIADGDPADYFLWVAVPGLGDYWYQVGGPWVPSELELVGYQGALNPLNDHPVTTVTVAPGLPRGAYLFHFAVDLDQDGQLDPTHFDDTITVNVE